jgi:TonB family protein
LTSKPTLPLFAQKTPFKYNEIFNIPSFVGSFEAYYSALALLLASGRGTEMLVENEEPKINFDGLQSSADSKRHLQLFLALALLLAALAVVVLRNQEFWVHSLGIEELTNQTKLDAVRKSEKISPAPIRKVGGKQSQIFSSATAGEATSASAETILPPLQVDVSYPSGEHKTLVARDSAVRIDLNNGSEPSAVLPSTAFSGGAASESLSNGGQVRFSPGAAEVVVRRVDPIYPPLAQRENIQGSVVLQARIDKAGSVQSVQVVSGPALLTSAALEAVKQWRFKPHDGGDPAATTETRITVNFSISTQ